MNKVNRLDELRLPSVHRKFIESYISNVGKFDFIERVILFGSCARSTARDDSDVDIFVTTKEDIPEDVEYEVIFDNVPRLAEGYVKNDILLASRQTYNRFKDTTGMVQKAVELEGVDLSGLLPVGGR